MLVKAKSDLARIRPLAEMKAVSQQDLDSAVAEYEAAQGSLQAAGAQLEQAEIEEILLEHNQLIANRNFYATNRLIPAENVYYLAEHRVDFRELVRQLAAEFQTRIEMLKDEQRAYGEPLQEEFLSLRHVLPRGAVAA